MTIYRIYLAGPDVFLLDAAALAEKKRSMCDDYGFVGISPVEDEPHEPDLSELEKRERALRLAKANQDAIGACHLLIANLTPFRGPSADPGTAYEMGFARALGRPVFGYTNVAGSLLDRMQREYGARITRGAAHRFEDANGMNIENFACFDNLMLFGAVEGGGSPVIVNAVAPDRRYSDLAGFESCLQLAARRFDVGKRTVTAGKA